MRWTGAVVMVLLLAAAPRPGDAVAPKVTTIDWRRIGPDGGRVVGLTVDPRSPSTLHAGSSRGVFRSDDRGERWRRIGGPTSDVDGLPVPIVAFALDPARPETLHAGTYGRGLYTSRDGGMSWTGGFPGGAYPFVNAVAVAPNGGGIYLGTPSGIQVSRDGGATWRLANEGLSNFPGISSPPIVDAVVLDPVQPTTLYALSASGAFRSVDAAAHWTRIETPFPLRALAVDPHDSQRLYGGVRSFGDSGGIYRSSDGGGHWSETLTGSGVCSIAIDVNGGAVYAGTTRGIVASFDDGLTWVPRTPDVAEGDCPEIVLVAPDAAILASTTQGVHRSEDAGTHWTPRSAGLDLVQVTDVVLDPTTPDTLYVATDAGVYRSADAGASWRYAGLRGVFRITIDRRTTSTLYAATLVGAFRSVDAGGHWNRLGLGEAAVHALAVDGVEPQRLYAGLGYRGGGVAVSTDGGDTWMDSSAGLPTEAVLCPPRFPTCGVVPIDVLALFLDPRRPGRIIVGTPVGPFRSTNGGVSWSAARGEASPVSALIGDLPDPDALFGVGPETVLHTDDGGISWRARTRGLDGAATGALAVDPRTLGVVYVGGAGVVFRSVDRGARWRRYGRALPATNVLALTVDPRPGGALYVGADRGVFIPVDACAGEQTPLMLGRLLARGERLASRGTPRAARRIAVLRRRAERLVRAAERRRHPLSAGCALALREAARAAMPAGARSGSPVRKHALTASD